MQPATDARANSLARLLPLSGLAAEAERWWYSILATDINATIFPEMLFPLPPPTLALVARKFGQTCLHGALASTCLLPFTSTSPLTTRTSSACKDPPCRHWELFSVAPVLTGGWVLLGEEGKYVAVSPQRLASAFAPTPARPATASDALVEAELVTSAGSLRFTVHGARGEAVRILVVSPKSLGNLSASGRVGLAAAVGGRIVAVDLVINATGSAEVGCTVDAGCSITG
jgi:hypothetical protein